MYEWEESSHEGFKYIVTAAERSLAKANRVRHLAPNEYALQARKLTDLLLKDNEGYASRVLIIRRDFQNGLLIHDIYGDRDGGDRLSTFWIDSKDELYLSDQAIHVTPDPGYPFQKDFSMIDRERKQGVHRFQEDNFEEHNLVASLYRRMQYQVMFEEGKIQETEINPWDINPDRNTRVMFVSLCQKHPDAMINAFLNLGHISSVNRVFLQELGLLTGPGGNILLALARSVLWKVVERLPLSDDFSLDKWADRARLLYK